jgi:hypothetical protein
MDTVLTSIQTSLTGSINAILPIAGGLFATIFGIKLIPKLIRVFVK